MTELLSVREVAQRLHVGRSTVLRWIDLGVRGVKLAAIRAGGVWRVSEDSLDDFLRRLNPDFRRQQAQADTVSPRQAARDRKELEELMRQ